MVVNQIISGGQTGADRAALDFAIQHAISHGGWCPKGRRAEDGTIDARYQLTETPSEDFAQRTEWNVRDSDGTVIISIGRNLAGGSRLTAELALRLDKPLLHLWEDGDMDALRRKLADFVEKNQIGMLNVAGPRLSTEATIEVFTKNVLEGLLDEKAG